jgi:hypothetical protein
MMGPISWSVCSWSAFPTLGIGTVLLIGPINKLKEKEMLWNSIKGLYYKTLKIRNLREVDLFCSKLVTFGLAKYTLAWTNTLA